MCVTVLRCRLQSFEQITTTLPHLRLHAPTPPPANHTLPLHAALPILRGELSSPRRLALPVLAALGGQHRQGEAARDRKGTRLNSSHGYISYAVFCWKKKMDWVASRDSEETWTADDECRS